MGLITKPYTATAGDTDRSADYNNNFDTLYNLVNGNLDTNNLSASAAIPDTKLNQISTANKVSGTALASLASTPSAAGIIPIANIPAAWTQVDWYAYGATSTVVGWSTAGTFTHNIYIKKIGNLAFTAFIISGTSNATGISFTLPYIASANPVDSVFGGALSYGVDNASVKTTSCRVAVAVGTTEAVCYADMSNAAWTNSGLKTVQGQFFYETV